jgi:hypothetical protein
MPIGQIPGRENRLFRPAHDHESHEWHEFIGPAKRHAERPDSGGRKPDFSGEKISGIFRRID